jgi:hypothetical protein
VETNVTFIQIIQRLISMGRKPKTQAEARRSNAFRLMDTFRKKVPIARRKRAWPGGPKVRGPARGEGFKSIIQVLRVNGREFQLHATKGWRCYRA